MEQIIFLLLSAAVGYLLIRASFNEEKAYKANIPGNSQSMALFMAISGSVICGASLLTIFMKAIVGLG